MTTHWAVLPHFGHPWLYEVVGRQPQPRSALPVTWGAITTVSPDGRFLGILDAGRQQAMMMGIHPETGAVRHVLPPLALPEDGTGHTIALYGDVLYVGGHNERGEMLWLRHAANPQQWQTVPLTLIEGGRGKAVDGLHVVGNRLVVVDDLVIPKWNLILDISVPHRPECLRVVEMPYHTTYEEVIASALGGRWLALLSSGINHGVGSNHLSLLDVDTLHEAGAWSYVEPTKWNEGEAEGEPGLADPRAVAWMGDRLHIAAGTKGILTVDFSDWTPDQAIDQDQDIDNDDDNDDDDGEDDEAIVESPLPRHRLITMPDLAEVTAIVVPQGKPQGCIAVGTTHEGAPHWVWLDTSITGL
jgi:hypothetical protein